MKLRVVVIAAALLGAGLGTTGPASAGHVQTPDNTDWPILHEVTENGVAAATYRVWVPEGGGIELASLVETTAAARDAMYLQVGWASQAGDDYGYRAFLGTNELRTVLVRADGSDLVRQEERASADSIPSAGLWEVADKLPAGVYNVSLITAVRGVAGWSRLRFRGTPGVAILNNTTSTSTFVADCRDFQGGTVVGAYASPVAGPWAAVDTSYTTSVERGLAGMLWMSGQVLVSSGSAPGQEVGTGRAGYYSPDGANHSGPLQPIASSAPGDYRFYVGYSAGRQTCGHVIGADITPAY